MSAIRMCLGRSLQISARHLLRSIAPPRNIASVTKLVTQSITPLQTAYSSGYLGKRSRLQRSYSSQASCSGGLRELNQLFLDSYAARKERKKHSLQISIPVILVNGDDLILRYLGARTVVKYVPESYHAIKSIAHIACLIHTARNLPESEGRAIREKCLATVCHMLTLAEEGKGSAEVLKYKMLMEKYKEILEAVAPSAGQLSQLSAPLKVLIEDAARCRLQALHEQTQAIIEGIPPEDKAKLCVVVMGPPMPREGELSMQYFHAALKGAERPGQCPYHNPALTSTTHTFQGQRLIYAESISEEDKALDLLTTHICDESLGVALLNNGVAMRADLLKDAAQRALQNMKPTIY